VRDGGCSARLPARPPASASVSMWRRTVELSNAGNTADSSSGQHSLISVIVFRSHTLYDCRKSLSIKHILSFLTITFILVSLYLSFWNPQSNFFFSFTSCLAASFVRSFLRSFVPPSFSSPSSSSFSSFCLCTTVACSSFMLSHSRPLLPVRLSVPLRARAPSHLGTQHGTALTARSPGQKLSLLALVVRPCRPFPSFSSLLFPQQLSSASSALGQLCSALFSSAAVASGHY
jgi:hypothetical protein